MLKNTIQLLSVSLLFLGLSSCVSNKKYNRSFPNHPLSVVQGSTSADQTFISVLSHSKQGDLDYYYSVEAKGSKKIRVLSFLKKKSPDGKRVVEQVHIKNLDPFQTYKLFIQNKKGHVLDERSFKSLNLSKRNIRLGVVSCTDDHISAATDMWSSYLNKFADVNFMIGDNVYADRLDDGMVQTATPEQLWTRYAQTWDRLYFYHSSSLSPTYYLWDDHDYGKNDGGSAYKYKEQSLDIFWTFHPGGEIKDRYQKTMGAGSVLKAFGQDFMFIDGRFFRDADKNGSRWGKAQTDKVIDMIKKTQSKLVWLIQGDQFFGAYHPFESFERGHSKDFKKTLKRLKSSKKKVIFVSGDRHLTEVMKIEKAILGYPTYEITSSGLHAKVFPGSFKRHPNPRGDVGASGVFNFTVIEFDREKLKDLKFKVISYGAKNWTHYTKEIDL